MALAIALALARRGARRRTSISYRIGGWDPSLGIEYRVDIFNALILVLVSAHRRGGRALCAALRGLGDRAEDKVAWFYTMYLLSLTGLLGIAITGDAFNAFVFLEISSLSSYALIAMGRDRRALVAAYQYLIVGTIGATFYVIGVGFLYMMTGTLNLDADRRAHRRRRVLARRARCARLHHRRHQPEAGAVPAACLAAQRLCLRAVDRDGLPRRDRDQGRRLPLRPLPVLRLRRSISSSPTMSLTPILMVLSIAAIFGAGTVAVFQSDVKRMFAYSSVAQIGYITLGLSLATLTGVTGGLVHLLNHALIKGAIFMALGAVVFRIGTLRLRRPRRHRPHDAVDLGAFVIAGLGLVGIPGTVGFVSKWYLVVAAFERGWWWLSFLIVASSLDHRRLCRPGRRGGLVPRPLRGRGQGHRGATGHAHAASGCWSRRPSISASTPA